MVNRMKCVSLLQRPKSTVTAVAAAAAAVPKPTLFEVNWKEVAAFMFGETNTYQNAETV